mmetsp:Transcript_8712/g.13471  ORF Transcript_8712/g.13471 Transcript_8712/m.13471 type:complete len:100 (+) Transcript_8712:154-453(+)
MDMVRKSPATDKTLTRILASFEARHVQGIPVCASRILAPWPGKGNNEMLRGACVSHKYAIETLTTVNNEQQKKHTHTHTYVYIFTLADSNYKRSHETKK